MAMMGCMAKKKGRYRPDAGATCCVRMLARVVRAQAIELRRVDGAVLARGAVLHRDRQMSAGLVDFPETKIGRRDPEMEFVIVGIAVELFREETPRGRVLAFLHCRHAEVEEIERGIGL